MFEEEQYMNEQVGGQNQQPVQPQIDPYELEKIRYEVELAYEEFQRLLSGRPRLYSRFKR